ncbi:GFA family protein [Nitrincola alkalilacustris]|uniref:GFA family protein n=1 Tax=Nitrincola alkalilacustris TaxID=1571224 RepID=UPI00124F72F0|nr:GFA family protein [Nitrincola alkalilacustris]
MSEQQTLQGQCLCGAVSLEATVQNQSVGACHCSICRKWGGGPLMALECGDDVKFDGEAHIGVFNSSDWAERGFCRECGTHLFYRLKEGGFHAIPAGLFANDQWQFDHQVFIDEKPAYYDFANTTKNMTGAEVFAQFGASQE